MIPSIGNMNVRHVLLCLILTVSVSLQAQTLSGLEYWFDQASDERVSLDLSGDSCSVTADISTSGLTDGLHWLYFRAVDTDTVYSGISASPFLKFDNAQGNRVEYWFDGDYGTLRTADAGLSDSLSNVAVWLDMDGLSYGMHRLEYRIRDCSGALTSASTAFVMNYSSGSSGRLEYWFDGDYGTVRSVETDNISDVMALLDMDGLSNGFHRLYYRIADQNGGMTPVSTAFVMNNGAGSPDRIEFWIDDGISESRMSESMETGEISVNLDLSYVPIGFHRLNFRTCSSDRSNSSHVGTAFIMVDYCDEPVMEFWLDDDSLDSYILPMTQYGNSLVSDSILDLNDAGSGFHRLYYRLSSMDGHYAGNVGMSPVFVTSMPDFCLQQDTSVIVKGLYWIDDEPQAAITDIEAGYLVDIEKLINLPGLSDGEHVLSMKFMDSNGRWTETDRTLFTKMRMENTESIDGIIYRYTVGQNEFYAAVAGYDDNISSAAIGQNVTILGNDFTVSMIEANALLGCTTIGDIASIPQSVTFIGDRAFAGTSLKEINLKASTPPELGKDVFPSGINLRVPVNATGYDTLSTSLETADISLTYDESCIYDSQWLALQRIDSLISVHGGSTGWDFTDRTSTPAGVSRWGTDNVREIDLSYRNIGGSFSSDELTAGLPQISRICLEGNSITDMEGQANYWLLQLDNQKYDSCADIVIDRSLTGTLASPEIPLLFRDANTGAVGNEGDRHVRYRLSTQIPDGGSTDGGQQEYAFILDAAPDGTVGVSMDNGNATNVYMGESGQYLSVTGYGIQTITPGSYSMARLFFMDGDTDMNGTADIADLQEMIGYIFGNSSIRKIFAWNAANLAEDDRINVQDVVGMVSIILSRMPDDVPHVSSRNGIVPDKDIQSDVKLIVSDCQLLLQSDADVAALDLILDNDADFAALMEMGFVVSRKMTDDGREHAVAYSLNGSVIPAGEHVIANFKRANTVFSAKTVDINANHLNTVTVNGNLTGVGKTGRIEKTNSYDINGRILSDDYNGIIIRNGDKILNGRIR